MADHSPLPPSFHTRFLHFIASLFSHHYACCFLFIFLSRLLPLLLVMFPFFVVVAVICEPTSDVCVTPHAQTYTGSTHPPTHSLIAYLIFQRPLCIPRYLPSLDFHFLTHVPNLYIFFFFRSTLIDRHHRHQQLSFFFRFLFTECNYSRINFN